MAMEQVIEISRDLLYTALLLALPTLAASLVVGLLISILQTITSIQEQTLTFVPRLLAAGLVLIVAMPWTMQTAIHFTMRMLERAAEVGR
ncbi:MAG TPA: flagellar biosynthetic protein FliQ [Terriglobales bacterium]|jgi:flagellar biosynthetic protein FliQ|nr:flagellar biosynthetic protein FliQ [Terriglobales bacterium]